MFPLNRGIIDGIVQSVQFVARVVDRSGLVTITIDRRMENYYCAPRASPPNNSLKPRLSNSLNLCQFSNSLNLRQFSNGLKSRQESNDGLTSPKEVKSKSSQVEVRSKSSQSVISKSTDRQSSRKNSSTTTSSTSTEDTSSTSSSSKDTSTSSSSSTTSRREKRAKTMPPGFDGLSELPVVLAMVQFDTPFIRLILVHVMVEAPESDTFLLMVTTGNTKTPRLIVHLVRTTMQDPNEDEDILWQRELIDASYELPTSSTDVPIKPISWQSLVIPLGERLSVWMKTVMQYPPLIVMYKDGATNLVDYQCFVFCNGSWHLEKLMTWLPSFRASAFNTKWLNAVNAFGELSPPDDWAWCEIQTFRHSGRTSGFTIDGAVFCATSSGGIQVRSIDPPSLQWLAAAAFCKAYPEYKLEDLLEAIGFDMFDGIFGHSEADAPLIYL